MAVLAAVSRADTERGTNQTSEEGNREGITSGRQQYNGLSTKGCLMQNKIKMKRWGKLLWTLFFPLICHNYSSSTESSPTKLGRQKHVFVKWQSMHFFIYGFGLKNIFITLVDVHWFISAKESDFYSLQIFSCNFRGIENFATAPKAWRSEALINRIFTNEVQGLVLESVYENSAMFFVA